MHACVARPAQHTQSHIYIYAGTHRHAYAPRVYRPAAYATAGAVYVQLPWSWPRVQVHMLGRRIDTY
jgi:hypothetical protein